MYIKTTDIKKEQLNFTKESIIEIVNLAFENLISYRTSRADIFNIVDVGQCEINVQLRFYMTKEFIEKFGNNLDVSSFANEDLEVGLLKSDNLDNKVIGQNV